MKNIPVKEMTFIQITEYIQSIYGKDVSIEFDNNCIEYLKVYIDDGKTKQIEAKYSKIKVTPKNAPPIYWPVGEISEELNLAYGLKLIKELP